MTRRPKRFGLRLSPNEREGLTRLAEMEGLTEAATLRRLLRQAIKDLLTNGASESAAQSQPTEAAREAA